MKTDGTFELRLPPGKYFVYVASGPFLVRKPDDPYANPDVTQVVVKEGTDLKLPPAIDVKGIVKDEQGQPIAGVQIRVNWNREHDLPEGTFVSPTDSVGRI